MNDEDVIADLKQFIAATVSQQSASLRDDIQKLDDKLSQKIDDVNTRLSGKIDDLSAAVAEALDNHSETTGLQLDDHEQRITRLEAKTA